MPIWAQPGLGGARSLDAVIADIPFAFAAPTLP